MTTIQLIANKIYKSLIPHEESVKKVEALVMWQRKAYSAIFLGIIEIVFIAAYFLPFSKLANASLILGLLCVANVTYNTFPEFFDKIFSFEYPHLPEDAPNRLRSVAEISAFITTCFSIWIRVVEFAYKALDSKNIINTAVTIGIIVLLFSMFYVLGDFWLIWILFHLVFILPGVILQPQFQTWMEARDEEVGSRRMMIPIATIDGTTIDEADEHEETKEIEEEEEPEHVKEE